MKIEICSGHIIILAEHCRMTLAPDLPLDVIIHIATVTPLDDPNTALAIALSCRDTLCAIEAFMRQHNIRRVQGQYDCLPTGLFHGTPIVRCSYLATKWRYWYGSPIATLSVINNYPMSGLQYTYERVGVPLVIKTRSGASWVENVHDTNWPLQLAIGGTVDEQELTTWARYRTFRPFQVPYSQFISTVKTFLSLPPLLTFTPDDEVFIAGQQCIWTGP
jgi:hypothetical protein